MNAISRVLSRFILMSTLVVLGCKDTDKNYYELDFYDYKLKPYHRSVFPDDFKPYDLTSDDIERCQKPLIEFVDRYNRSYGEKVDISKYGQQYIGALDDDGHIIVYINCFCRPEKVTYKEDYLVVANDGGNCYIQVSVDLTSNQLVYSSINGGG